MNLRNTTLEQRHSEEISRSSGGVDDKVRRKKTTTKLKRKAGMKKSYSTKVLSKLPTD